ncbi:MAG: putative glycosyltransferase [Bacteroidetes bacterium]|nr:putative glycosyltransferase [Bacteroidota bacterium]
MKTLNSSQRERSRRSLFASLTALHDSIVIFFSLAIGYAINFQHFSFERFFSQQWKLVLYSTILYVGLSATLGVYRQAYTSALRLQVAAAARAYTLGTLIIFATLFLFRNTYYSNGVLLTYIVVIPLVFLTGRWILDRLRATLYKRKWGLETTVVVLLDEEGSGLPQNLSAGPFVGFDVRSVIDISRLDTTLVRQSIDQALAAHDATCLMFGTHSIDSPLLSDLIAQPYAGNIMIRLVTPEVHETLTRMRLYDFGGIALSGPARVVIGTGYRALKRVFDAVLSTVLVVITSPFLAIVALAIRLESAGSALFRQVRHMSAHSKPLHVFKFRSMRQNGGEESISGGDGSKGSANTLLKSPDDPRITGIGRLMRKFSIDELPQLLNVIRGEMSLVGPRPLPLLDFRKLPSTGAVAFLFERRALVKPGLTGLWQISGRSGLNFQQMVILDLYYAENQTFLFDLEILFETIPAVISGRGAY